jgi:phosphate transport system protein
MRIRFHQDLDKLKHRILSMASIAEQAIDLAVQAYTHRDPTLCERVIAHESAINRAQREVDQHAVDLLAMQQPMAIDLRFILAVIKMNADLERVGDQAVNIVQRVMNMIELPASELPVDIPAMAAQVRAMVRDALRAFIEGDTDLAKHVLEADDEVDRINREAFASLSLCLRSHPDSAVQALDLISITRNLERVADHATNIAEGVIFWIHGADVRHGAGLQFAVN